MRFAEGTLKGVDNNKIDRNNFERGREEAKNYKASLILTPDFITKSLTLEAAAAIVVLIFNILNLTINNYPSVICVFM